MISAREREARTAQIRLASGLNALLGLWLIAAPFALGYAAAPTARWNAVGAGVLIATLATVRLGVPSRSAWMCWVNGALGAWLVTAPLFLRYGSGSALLNDVLVGMAVAFLGFRSAKAGPPD